MIEPNLNSIIFKCGFVGSVSGLCSIMGHGYYCWFIITLGRFKVLVIPKRGRQVQRKRAQATVPTEQRMSIVTGL